MFLVVKSTDVFGLACLLFSSGTWKLPDEAQAVITSLIVHSNSVFKKSLIIPQGALTVTLYIQIQLNLKKKKNPTRGSFVVVMAGS